jgi:FixJ family two-component response regulator
MMTDLCQSQSGGIFLDCQLAIRADRTDLSLVITVRKTIFVVDDDPSMRLAVKRLLDQYGFETEVFDSVEDFHKRADVGRADCLVLDVMLKNRSGIDLRTELASSGVSVPVIFITANDSDNTRNAATAAGCIAYLTKPFSGNSLNDAINQATDPIPSSA